MPDQNQQTPDVVSLKDYLSAIAQLRFDTIVALLEERDQRFQQRWEATTAVSAERLASLHTQMAATDKTNESRYRHDDKFEQIELLMRALAERCDVRFVAQEDMLKASMLSSEKAILKAEAANEKRFEGVNEFRMSLSDQTNSFVTRNEMASRDNINADMKERLTRIEGTSKGVAQFQGLLFGALGLVIAAGAVIINLAK